MDGSGELHAPPALPLERTPGAIWLGSWAVPNSAVEESLLPLSGVEPRIVGSHTTVEANCFKDMAWDHVEPLGSQFM